MKNIIKIAFIIIMIGACGNRQVNEQQTQPAAETVENKVSLTDAQVKTAEIAIGKVETRNMSSILKVNGKIDVPPQNIVSISVPLGGYLKETKLLPGMHVAKGEHIAVLEDPQYIELQQDYLTARTKLVYTEAEYIRQKELNQSKAASDKMFQQVSADFSSQKILLRSLAEKLRLIGINPESLNENNISRSISISSPIEGFVTHVNVNIGKYTRPEDVLFEIVNPADIHLQLTIFEKDIDKLFVGQKLLAYTNSNPKKKYPCEIILIGQNFSNDRGVEVHCHFRNYDRSLIPGMFMNADIEVHSDSADALPSDAIVSFENKQYIFIATGKNEFELTPVVTGNSENGFVEITPVSGKDLSGTGIVTKGAYSLLMKMKNVDD